MRKDTQRTIAAIAIGASGYAKYIMARKRAVRV